MMDEGAAVIYTRVGVQYMSYKRVAVVVCLALFQFALLVVGVDLPYCSVWTCGQGG
jgi:hypothetical protein